MLHIDNHLDRVRLAQRRHCGSWVNRVLALFPWPHEPSRLRRRIADGPGHEWRAGQIHWRNLGERQLEHATHMVLDAIPTGPIWVTIDKDVLPEHETLANRNHGRGPKTALAAMLRAMGAAKRLLGADVCGEYSPPRHASWLKRVESRLDQLRPDTAKPRRIDGNVPTDCEPARNFRRLWRIMAQMLSVTAITLLLLLGTIACDVCGQVCFKLGAGNGYADNPREQSLVQNRNRNHRDRPGTGGRSAIRLTGESM